MIFVISGPSGSGKTSLRDKLLEDRQLKKALVKSVSLTTRAQRSGERDKRDYFFVSEGEFKKRRREKKILEWTRYLGYYYATPRDFVENQLKAGRHILLCLDLKGALRVKQLYPADTKTIFILPPSIKALRERIQGRCSKTARKEIERRIKLAGKETLASSNYDFRVVNKNMNRAVAELRGLILGEIRNVF